jgi:uncharacterized protein (DUF1778 family)
MTLTIDLPSDLEQTVRQHAARRGQDVNGFILQAVEEKIAKARTIAEICQPIAKAVAATGITDQEFDEFFEEARNEVWQEKQRQAH